MLTFTEIIIFFEPAGALVFRLISRENLDYLHGILNNGFNLFFYLSVGLTIVYLVLNFYVIFTKNKRNEAQFDDSNAPFVTIQIPTRNEIVALDCAKRCLEFDYPQDKYEILIGDDSNEPLISMEIGNFAKLHDKVKVYRREQNIGFKPGNLNNMLKYSHGEILVLFDSDFLPEKDFLKRIISPFIYDKNLSAAQARWNFVNFGQNLVSIMASTIVYVFHHVVLAFMNRFDSGSLCGSAEAVRKSDLIALGGWKSGSLTEDVEYSMRLHKANKNILYLPELECYSIVPFKPIDLYKQQMRWAHGVITAYRDHFSDILFDRTKNLPLKRKLLSTCAGFGYALPVLMLLLFVSGILSFVTHEPAPIDILLFLSDFSKNIALTAGLIIASVYSLYKANKLKYLGEMVVSSFSVGIITTYYVNKGIFKSLFRKPMDWYLLNKDVAKA